MTSEWLSEKHVKNPSDDLPNCFFKNTSNESSNIRSLTSMRVLADSLMLFKLTTSPTNLDLTLRLIQQCTFLSRYPNKIVFFDYSYKRVGHTSFINRSKVIAELIPFEWIDLTLVQFKKQMMECTPKNIRWWYHLFKFQISLLKCSNLHSLHLHEQPALLGGFFPLVGQSNELVIESVQ